MHVRVRLFARQREIAGTREVPLELPAGATVGDAWAAVALLHPGLADGRPYVRFARNGVYAAAETELEDGDEVACIPPVSGGAGGGGGGAERRLRAAAGDAAAERLIRFEQQRAPDLSRAAAAERAYDRLIADRTR